MSEGPEITIDACPECRAAVFDGERFCEACGYKLAADVAEPEDPKAAGWEEPAVSPENKQRIHLEMGSVAAVTDRGWRRQRNEDAVTLAAVGDRSAVAVCDGVASTSNAHRAAQAAAAAAIRALDYALAGTRMAGPPRAARPVGRDVRGGTAGGGGNDRRPGSRG